MNIYSLNKHHNMMMAIIVMLASFIASYYEAPKLILRFLQFSSVAFLLAAAFFRPEGRLYQYRYPKKFLFVLLAFLSIIAMLRGVATEGINYNAFVKLITSPKIFLVYLFPLLLGCSALTYNYKGFYRACTILTFVFAIIVFANLNDLITSSMMRAAGFSKEDVDVINISDLVAVASVPLVLFLQRDILPKNVWSVSLFNILLLLFVSLLNARRSASYGVVLILLFAVLKEKRLRWLTVLLAALLVYIMYSGGLLDFMFGRVDENTRSIVVENFLNDMDTQSWIFGRGAAGTYYDPSTTFIESEGLRSEIETGYLDLILKGGIIYLITYVVCLGYAAYLGWRRSKNALCNSFAIIIFVSLLELIPYGIPTWNLKFLSIWMGVGICLNPQIRAMNNREIKQMLGLEKQ